jgi:hypothetical protein
VERIEPQSCERCHVERAVDPHELVRQAHGDTGTDLDMIVPVGRACHDWITHHPVRAHDEGWALWSWERGDEAALHRAWMARLGFREEQ